MQLFKSKTAAGAKRPSIYSLDERDQQEFAIRYWQAHFYSSLIVFTLVLGVTLVYLHFSPEGAHRALLTKLTAGLFILALIMFALPARLLAASRWRLSFFHGWTSCCICLSFLLIWLDGGVGSPTVLYLYLIMIFVNQTYSWQSALVYMLVEFLAYCLVVMLHPDSQGWQAHSIFVLGLLTLTNAWGMAVAYNRELRERAAAYFRDKLAFMASHDVMTGCLNGLAFRDRCQQEIAAACQGGRTLSVFMIDLDNFKAINDEYGHQEGDKALCLVADILREEARHTDVPCRIGGDEFVLLAPDTDQEAALKLAERLCHRIESEAVGGGLTLSIGVCTTICSREWHHKELLKCADDALYTVKRAGRNGVKLSLFPQ